MYVVTNLEEIAAAIEAKTPRPIGELMREIYPDATEDANGRFHAPYDGYFCPLTDREFRGGEYLPMEEPEEGYRVMGRSAPRISVVLDGEIFCFSDITKAQIIAGNAVAKRQQTEIDCTKSHVGKLGSRENFELLVTFVFHKFGEYGSVFTHHMRDAENNLVIYKGSKKLADVGEIVKIKATVKSHWVAYDGRKSTYISRPAKT